MMNSKLKKTALSLLVAAALGAAGTTQAHERGARYEYARVLSVEPAYKTVKVPYEQEVCHQEREYRHARRHGNAAPVILGAVLGGLAGNRIDGGYHRGTGTAIGAVVGGSIAHAATRDRGGYRYPVDHEYCETSISYRYEERPAGYLVRYRYHGDIYETRTDYDPGERIRVRVDVSPARY